MLLLVRVALARAGLAVALAGGSAVIGCGAASSAPPLPPPPVEPATPPAVSGAPAVEPAALPFHLPCADDDVVGCTHACNDKFVEDCATLGAMYLKGTVVSVDPPRAVELFRTACAGDSARGCVRLADAYHAGIVPPDGREPHAEEVLFYRRACEGGANLGCLAAGRALVAGHGVDRDPAQAAKLFGPVCERGNAEACLELGKLTQRGEGVTRNPERALSLYRKACSLGLQEGCLHVSLKGEERSPRGP